MPASDIERDVRCHCKGIVGEYECETQDYLENKDASIEEKILRNELSELSISASHSDGTKSCDTRILLPSRLSNPEQTQGIRWSINVQSSHPGRIGLPLTQSLPMCLNGSVVTLQSTLIILDKHGSDGNHKQQCDENCSSKSECHQVVEEFSDHSALLFKRKLPIEALQRTYPIASPLLWY